MTMRTRSNRECALCHKISTHGAIMSISIFGAPDLDTRPPEMARSTIDTQVQRCPFCEYCAPDISKSIKKASKIIRTEQYQQQLNNNKFPELANSFLCCALIEEKTGEYSKAGWSCVQAAWVCDDKSSICEAEECRKEAITLFQKARKKRQRFANKSGIEEVVFIDLARRSNQFELALKLCNNALEKNPGRLITGTLKFQKQLIINKDADSHTMEEVSGIKSDAAKAHDSPENAPEPPWDSDYKKSIELSKEAIRIHPDDASLHHALGRKYHLSHNNQEAIEPLKEAVRIKPDYSEAYFDLGLAYGALDDNQKAIEAYKKVARVKPEDVILYSMAQSNLGHIYLSLGDYPKAIEFFQEAIRIEYGTANANYDLGKAYRMSGDYQKAIELYKNALWVGHQMDYYVHYGLGLSYRETGDYQKAIESFKKVIHNNNDHAEAHYDLGITYIKTGDSGNAIDEYKTLKTLNKELADKLFNLINNFKISQ